MTTNRKFDDDAYREGWLDAHVKHLIAAQFRAMRANQTQEEFGKSIGASQSVVARYENPAYGSMTINTLLDIAKKRRVGLLVRFVPFSRVMDEAKRLEFDDLAPLSYEQDMKVRNAQKLPAIADNAAKKPYRHVLDVKKPRGEGPFGALMGDENRSDRLRGVNVP